HPLMWLCLPDWITARHGQQMALVTKTLRKSMPSCAIRSRLGVSLMREPYAPTAWAAWSSEKTKTMFGRVGGSSSAIGAAADRLVAHAAATSRSRPPPTTPARHARGTPVEALFPFRFISLFIRWRSPPHGAGVTDRAPRSFARTLPRSADTPRRILHSARDG